MHFTQSGGGRYTGTITLTGTHGEQHTAADSFGAALPNGLRYGALRRTHVADYRALYGRLGLSLGTSTSAQRELDTWERLHARTRDLEPDPELEAAYLQLGRYLVLIDDSDWSPEHGPQDAQGITYAQELVWVLFGNYCTAAAELRRDTDYADTIAGWLEEWMSPDNLSETTTVVYGDVSRTVTLQPGTSVTLKDLAR